jgi:hypothetical protein
VLVALAARDPRMDALVAECGRVVVALPEDCVAGIADLAVAELEALSRTVERVAPPAGAIARAEARLGLR